MLFSSERERERQGWLHELGPLQYPRDEGMLIDEYVFVRSHTGRPVYPGCVFVAPTKTRRSKVSLADGAARPNHVQLD